MSFKKKLKDTDESWMWSFPWDVGDDMYNSGSVDVAPTGLDSDIELLYATLALGGEAGELQNKVKKYFRGKYLTDGHADPDVLSKIGEELIDVIFYTLRVGKCLNIDVDKAWEEKRLINKERYASGVSKKND